jgi:hypothetical protein
LPTGSRDLFQISDRSFIKAHRPRDLLLYI